MTNFWMLSLVTIVVSSVQIFVVVAGERNGEEQAKIEEVSSSLKALGEDLTSPDVNFDHQGWRVVGAGAPPQVETAFPEMHDNWKEEEIQPQPPRRRRPGRKRKRRPYIPTVDGIVPAEQDGVRFNVEGGIQVAFDSDGGERSRQRRPQRMPEEQHWRGDARDERPLRRRGHRRKQRPYLPNLENGGQQSFPIKMDTSFQVNTGAQAHIRVVGEDYKVAPFAEEINRGFENGEQLTGLSDDVELTTVYFEEAERENKETNNGEGNERDEPISNNKSYRRPYSQAKKQEAEFAPMGSSSDLKALLKQSGGLSLSEVLQQKNLSLSDLLTGKQHALSALKTSPVPQEGFKPMNQNENEQEGEIKDTVERYDSDSSRRRLPAVSKDNQQRQRRIKPASEDGVTRTRDQSDQIITNNNRRRLPSTNGGRRQKPKSQIKENNEEPKDTIATTTTERNVFIPKKSTSENLIQSHREQDSREETAETSKKNYIDDSSDVFTTTEEVITTTMMKKVKHVEEVRNRLSLKPRLRLPTVKTSPKRILNPQIHPKGENNVVKSKMSLSANLSQNVTPERVKIPNQAIPINIKDLFGMSDIVSAAKIITKVKPGSGRKDNVTTSTIPTVTIRNRTTKLTTVSTTTKPTIIPGKISAKDEILEVLTDERGGQKLTKILAERNMTLKELVEHRERGSSQVHLADIFHNASREPDPAEPFLAKSLIEPISKEIYPLKALLEGNMRDTSTSASKQKSLSNADPPPMFMDISKTSQDEESLGIVTLFDKFSEFVGHPKIFDAKDIKKDSDGSSYFTSVINVKPTDEIYRESRSESGIYNSHKQISEIYSSIPTYLKSDNVVEAKVVPDWNVHNAHNKNSPLDLEQAKSHIDKDMDGDGLIVLDDIQRVEQVDNHIAQASNQNVDNSFIDQNRYENEREPNFYTKLPVGVRSAIIVSSSIVGTSLVVFLTIFVACKWRQRKRNLLKYNDSFSTSRVRSPILDGSRKTKKNSSSRSISPILPTGETIYKNQKINTMDSQTQREAQDYLWDSLRRPFQ